MANAFSKNGFDALDVTMNSLISKEKLGFNVNTINLWNTFGHETCKEFFDNSRIVKDGWISDDWIKKYIDNSSLNVKYINKFLGLLAKMKPNSLERLMGLN